MFGFGLKLKSKPKPTISAARRPRDQVVDASQNPEVIGPSAISKHTSDESVGQAQNSNSEKIEQHDKLEKSTPIASSNCAKSLTHQASENIDIIKDEVTCRKNLLNSLSVTSKNNIISDVTHDRTSSQPISDVDCVIRNHLEGKTSEECVSTVNNVLPTVDVTEKPFSNLENSLILNDGNKVDSSSENVSQDINRQKSVPFIPKLLPKKNKFVPNLRAVRKIDDQSDKPILNSPQKNSDSNKNETDSTPTPIAAAVNESHSNSDESSWKTAETLERSNADIENEALNQPTTSEKLQEKESPTQPVQSPQQINTHKELVTPSKPVSENSADKENTICNDDNQIHTPGNLLQNSKKKKQRAQGTFLQMTIEAKREINEKLKNGVLDKSKLIMRDLILYNPTSNPMPVKSRSKVMKEEKKCKSGGNSIVDEILYEQSVDDVEATRDSDAGSMPVPQLKVGPDGKIILDSTSLVIETTGTEKSRTDLQNSELVEENEFSGFKYRKRRARRNDWSAEETVLFYKALNDLGADFSLMQSLFPSRTRRDLKLKFKKEERCNLSLVDKAMTHVGKFDFDALKEELTRDRAERTRRQEEQARIKEEAKKMLKLQKMEAKIKEREMKAKKSRKIAKERCNVKHNEKKNDRKGIKRNKKSPANDACKPKRKRSKKTVTSDSDSADEQPLYSDKSMDNCNENINDTMFKTTKSGRKPKLIKRMKEECEKNKIRQLLKFKKASDILKEQIDYFNDLNMEVVEEVEEEKEEELQQYQRPQESKSVDVVRTQEIEICLFEEPSRTYGCEGTNDLPNKVVDDQNNKISDVPIMNLGSRMQMQSLPETIKIVEELTSGIAHRMVDVNGVKCKIIALGDDHEFGRSSFHVRDSLENDSAKSNCSIRLETDSAESNCEQLNYVISYAENDPDNIELSQVVTGETNPSFADHSYCIAKPPDNEVVTRSYVVLKPNECVEIYKDS